LHGTISSGFHFVDNHEVVQINKDLADANGNVFNVMATWVKNDLGGRFRPMYMIDNVIVYTTLHGNFFLISLYHTLIIILIIFFLFLSLRKLGFHLPEALTFPLIALTGVQSAIWWRLGPNETIGMWYLSITFVFMVYEIKSKTKNGLFRILFCISTALMMFCKESFLLLSPAVILSYLTLEKLESAEANWTAVLKKHIPELFIIVALFIVSIGFILIKVNTENLGYAGIKGVNPIAYLTTFGKLLTEGCIGIISIIVFCISGVLSYRWSQNKRKTLNTYFLVLFISLCILIPQSFLYAKSGIFERYFLPGMLAWAFMLAFSLNCIRNVVEQKATGNRKMYLLIEIALLLCLIVPRLFLVSREATQFTKDGKEVNAVLSMITENIL
jgi:hypothetical protein